MSKVFISYGRQNEAMAKNLVSDFGLLGHDVWYDREVSGGQAWWDQILVNIRGCDVFVFLLDPKALHSIACQREWGYAGALSKPILPILVADGVNLLPPELSQIQYVDYRKQDRSSAFGLARALAGIPPVRPLPDPLPPPPEAPVSHWGGLAHKIDAESALSHDEQSALMADLGSGLRELPISDDDARVLLERLRKRSDLFMSIAEEIDELLPNYYKSKSQTSKTKILKKYGASFGKRLLLALSGIVVGAIFVITFLSAGKFDVNASSVGALLGAVILGAIVGWIGAGYVKVS